jgi:hypothetical protein
MTPPKTGFLGMLENMLRGSSKPAVLDEREANLARAKEEIDSFLSTTGRTDYKIKNTAVEDDGALIEKAGTSAGRIMFKHYPRFQRVRDEQLSDIKSKLHKNKVLYEIAVELSLFIDMYLANPRMKKMDYGIFGRKIPVYNKLAGNRMNAQTKQMVYEQKLMNGVRDINTENIENYMIKDACDYIQGYANELSAYLAGRKDALVELSVKMSAYDKFMTEFGTETTFIASKLGTMNFEKTQLARMKSLCNTHTSHTAKFVKAGGEMADILDVVESVKTLNEFLSKKHETHPTMVMKDGPQKTVTGTYRNLGVQPDKINRYRR